jgi:hypothetical protein
MLTYKAFGSHLPLDSDPISNQTWIDHFHHLKTFQNLHIDS